MENIAQAILGRLRLVLLVVLVFMGATLGVSLWQTLVYKASAKLGLGVDWEDRWETDIPGVMLIPTTVTPLHRVVVDVARDIKSPAIAGEAIERLGLDGGMEPGELLDNLSVEQEGSPHFIQLSYKDTDPETAQQVVNAVAEVASEEIRQEPPYVYDLRVQVWERASVPSSPVSPNPLRNAALALILGLAVGIGLALLMERRAT
jgi:capsular polysaccharide biosynthesis protein